MDSECHILQTLGDKRSEYWLYLIQYTNQYGSPDAAIFLSLVKALEVFTKNLPFELIDSKLQPILDCEEIFHD